MSESYIQRLREQRANAWEQAKALLDAAAAENRDLTSEEDEVYTRMSNDLDRIAERVAHLEEDEKRAGDTAAAFDRLAARPVERHQESKANELRAFARGELGKSYHVDFAGLSARDLTKGTSTSGGATIKTSFREQLWAHLIEVAGVIGAGATVLNTAGGENLEMPTTTAHSSAALTAENVALTESDPAFTKRTLGAYKYGLIVQAPSELIADTSVDLEGYLAMQAGRAVGNAFGAHLATGTGSSQPAGIVTGSSLGVTAAASTAGVVNADKMIDLFYSVIAPYRNSPSCAWLMKDVTVGSVRKLKGSDNNYLWQPGLQVGAPDLLLGKPVYTDPNVAAEGTTAKSVVFGDFSQYYVRIAGGVRFERSDEFAFNTDQVTFRCLIRGDGVLLDQTGAVKHFIGAAT